MHPIVGSAHLWVEACLRVECSFYAGLLQIYAIKRYVYQLRREC
jgi:hypothetical protein